MRWLFGTLLLVCFALFNGAWADEVVDICFNYGCSAQAQVVFSDVRLADLGKSLALAINPEQERALLALSMGQLYAWAGEQTPIRADKGGNYADEGEPGSMDCVDHSLTTERLLQMLERRGMLRFHRVVGRIKRVRHLIMEHNAVEIEVRDEALNEEICMATQRYVVDSWFVDNGMPAVILPKQNWMNGDDPDV